MQNLAPNFSRPRAKHRRRRGSFPHQCRIALAGTGFEVGFEVGVEGGPGDGPAHSCIDEVHHRVQVACIVAERDWLMAEVELGAIAGLAAAQPCRAQLVGPKDEFLKKGKCRF